MKSASVLLLFLPILFASSCGRKNNNFLMFEPKETIIKINKLTFPTVCGLKALHINESTIQLTWEPVAPHVDHGELIGYNLYKFIQTAFIPRKPVNKRPLKQTTYLDKRNTKDIPFCYLVRSVFITHGKTIEGPASKIVW